MKSMSIYSSKYLSELGVTHFIYRQHLNDIMVDTENKAVSKLPDHNLYINMSYQ